MRPAMIALVAVMLIATLLSFSSPILSAASSDVPSYLAGDWTSVRTFGPTLAAGEVVLALSGNTWTAKIAGEQASSTNNSHSADFHFIDGSELRVRVETGGVIGQWIQPKTVTTGYRFASPVRFNPDSGGGWHGQIHPIKDQARFYLFFQKTSTGSFSAYFRNPESNAGARIGTRRVIIADEKIVLAAQGSPDIVARTDRAHYSITFRFEGYPGNFVFRRYVHVLSTAPLLGSRASVASNGDGWQTASPEEVGFKSDAITALLNRIDAPVTSVADPYIQSIQIARHGKLVLDEYFNGFDIDRPHDVRSAGKSITTLLVGAAIQSSGSITPRTPVYPLFPSMLRSPTTTRASRR